MMQSQLIESTSELLPGLQIRSYKKGFQNTIIQARLGHEEVFVKIYGVPSNFLIESLALDKLKGTSLTLPRLRAQYRDLCINVLSPVLGRPLKKEDCSHDIIKNLVDCLEILHGGQATLPPEQMVLDLYVRNIDESRYIREEEKRLVGKIANAIRTTLSNAMEQKFVHGDLNASNVLYCPESQGIGFIDFERARNDHPFADLAKFSWRVLDNDLDLVRALLIQYLKRFPDEQERQVFNAYWALESLGAISYYAFAGHANNYPYKDNAILNLCRWPLLK